MIAESDYSTRGWTIVPAFIGANGLAEVFVREMSEHPECPGESSWGTRNLLYSMILSMRPKLVLEIGSHIGSGSVVIGAALRANKFGTLYCLEPADHYFAILSNFVEKAKLTEYVKPLKMFSTDSNLKNILSEPLDMIFLDANHSYSHALSDIRFSHDMLAENGLIFLDDVGQTISAELCKEGKGGVRQALIDYLSDNSDLRAIFFEPPFWLNPCGLAIVCKQNVLI